MVTMKSVERYSLKRFLTVPFRLWFYATARFREPLRRLYSHAYLASQLVTKLPKSVVVLGRIFVDGTGAVAIGDNCFLYPDLHLETRARAAISIGDGVVISRGVHLVAMAGITIGRGSMIGEYASVRDANHTRLANTPLRESGHVARPIVIGNEVWIGRGVTILGGITIGDGATIGANAVVTRDVPSNATVVGVPARPISKSRAGIKSES